MKSRTFRRTFALFAEKQIRPGHFSLSGNTLVVTGPAIGLDPPLGNLLAMLACRRCCSPTASSYSRWMTKAISLRSKK
jgi:hypothetical protein